MKISYVGRQNRIKKIEFDSKFFLKTNGEKNKGTSWGFILLKLELIEDFFFNNKHYLLHKSLYRVFGKYFPIKRFRKLPKLCNCEYHDKKKLQIGECIYYGIKNIMEAFARGWVLGHTGLPLFESSFVYMHWSVHSYSAQRFSLVIIGNYRGNYNNNKEVGQYFPNTLYII